MGACPSLETCIVASSMGACPGGEACIVAVSMEVRSGHEGCIVAAACHCHDRVRAVSNGRKPGREFAHAHRMSIGVIPACLQGLGRDSDSVTESHFIRRTLWDMELKN